MLDRIKKLTLSLSIIVLFILYGIQQRNDPASGVIAADPLTRDDTTPAESTPARAIATATPTAATRRTATPPRQTVSTATATPTAKPEEPTSTPEPTATPEPTEEPNDSPYDDGTFTGDTADSRWGELFVEVVIEDGEIVDVHVPLYPDHRDRSVRIDERALPRLIEEAIEQQSAEVDIVSGATDTSVAFIESMESALGSALR